MSSKFSDNQFFIILNKPDVTNRIINRSDHLSVSALRTSADGLKCILQFSGAVPEEVIDYRLYTDIEIKEILATTEWLPTEDL